MAFTPRNPNSLVKYYTWPNYKDHGPRYTLSRPVAQHGSKISTREIKLQCTLPSAKFVELNALQLIEIILK